jgi:trans-aconitate 2-methyltransferase
VLGGAIAIQMPCNHTSPSHLLMEEAAADGPWRAKLAAVRPIYRSVETPETYYRILAPLLAQVDIWETSYLHVLAGANPVVEWTKGTALRPYLDALTEPERGGFLAAYQARVAAAYPKQPDGHTLLPFRRLFIVGQAHGSAK